ncbi:ArsR/SmtB family transcription factor [Williamsia sp. SKLECPSW1]
MLTYHLGVDDLARVRLAYSPMFETSMSLWALRWGTEGRTHLADWYAHVRSVAGSYDADIVDALVSPSGKRIPDFVTPLPTSAHPSVDHEVESIARADPIQVRRDLVDLAEGKPLAPALASMADDPTRLARTVADTLRDYHAAVIAPFWSDIARILESDVTYRGREFVRRGAVGLFDGLTDSVRWLDEGLIEVSLTSYVEAEGVSGGQGLVLTPSVFTRRAAASWQSYRTGTSWIAYPARGQGTLAGGGPAVDPDLALRELLGTAKADILQALSEPTSTSALAQRFGVSPSAVSQNLRVLRANGLVESSRHGREVLYRLSAIGTALTGRSRPS